MKLEFSGRIFEKYSKTKFNENLPCGSQVVPCAQTDRHDEVKTCFSQFCERTQKCLLMSWVLPVLLPWQQAELWVMRIMTGAKPGNSFRILQEVRDLTSSHMNTYFLMNLTVNILL